MKDDGQLLVEGSEIFNLRRNTRYWRLCTHDYDKVPQEAEVGDTILLDDGLLEFKVTECLENSLKVNVIVGGLLKSRKGVNLPNVKISIPALTQKDRKDLEFAVNMDADYVALSFVRNPEDVIDLKKLLKNLGSEAGVIAKIEKPEAVDCIDAIIEQADGIMVARGDLGIEIPAEEVPFVQKTIIEKCRAVGKPVITATQMLDSMINNPRPTRAETSDVANTVLDGTDVMLSGETAAGNILSGSNVMDHVCRKIESVGTTLQ